MPTAGVRHGTVGEGHTHALPSDSVDQEPQDWLGPSCRPDREFDAWTTQIASLPPEHCMRRSFGVAHAPSICRLVRGLWFSSTPRRVCSSSARRPALGFTNRAYRGTMPAVSGFAIGFTSLQRRSTTPAASRCCRSASAIPVSRMVVVTDRRGPSARHCGMIASEPRCPTSASPFSSVSMRSA